MRDERASGATGPLQYETVMQNILWCLEVGNFGAVDLRRLCLRRRMQGLPRFDHQPTGLGIIRRKEAR